MKSIRARLTLALIAAGALLLAVLGCAVHIRARALLTAQFDDGLRARAAALVSLLHWQPDGSATLDYKGEFMPEFEHRRGGFFFEVRMEKSGDLLEHSHSLHYERLPAAATGTYLDFTLASGKRARAIAIHAPRVIEEERSGESAEPGEKHRVVGAAESGAQIIVAGTTHHLAKQLRQLALELTGACGLGIVLLAFLVRRILASGLGKLVEFSHLAARLDAGKLTGRFPTHDVPAELAPIATRLNDLLARLENAFARERRFSADVAHELRTPIAELRALADVGAGIPGASAEADAFFHDARAIAEKMDATVSALLLIARCESGGQPIQRERVDLAAVLIALCAESTPRACGRALECLAPSPVFLETDPALFTRLASLLLENAVAYTPACGFIRVVVNAGECTIANGPTDLAPTDLPRLGERFWRKDPARADSAHAGLGLALAAEIARLLGVHLTSTLDANTVLTTRVSWSDAD